MYDYYSNRLPLIFDNFFKSINKVYQYQTRLASKISYYLPKARINYGKFNIRFFGAKVWNSIDDSLKSKSCACFKNLSLAISKWLCSIVIVNFSLYMYLSIVNFSGHEIKIVGCCCCCCCCCCCYWSEWFCLLTRHWGLRRALTFQKGR